MINTQELVRKLRPVSVDRLEDLGDVLQYAIPWAALLVVALQGDAGAARLWLYAGLGNAVLTTLLKYLFNGTPLGKRPNGDPYAFPSGHTSSAFMGAAFLHLQSGLALGIPGYALALVTGYSRVQAGKHWWRDVVAGAALGVAVVVAVLQLGG